MFGMGEALRSKLLETRLRLTGLGTRETWGWGVVSVICFQFFDGFVWQWSIFLPGLAGGSFGVIGDGLPGGGTGLKGEETAEGAGELAVEAVLITGQNFR